MERIKMEPDEDVKFNAAPDVQHKDYPVADSKDEIKKDANLNSSTDVVYSEFHCAEIKRKIKSEPDSDTDDYTCNTDVSYRADDTNSMSMVNCRIKEEPLVQIEIKEERIMADNEVYTDNFEEPLEIPRIDRRKGNKVYARTLTCEICPRRFYRKESLYNHRISVHKKKWSNGYQCGKCGKTCLTPETRRLHIRSMHMQQQEPYKCRTCNEGFVRLDDFTMHQRLHKRDKEFECRICKRMFVREETLIKHMPIHTGEEYYRCEICNKLYYTSGVFARHKRSHKK